MSKKSKTRIGALCMTLILALSLAVSAFAAESDFTIKDGVLTKYNGPGGDAVIPDDVTSIGDAAFVGCTDLTSVTIPNSVTNIGEWAFHDCTGLTSVTIPDSVTSIGDGAFGGCASLIEVNIPDSVTNLGAGAFSNCSSLTSVTIPISITRFYSHEMETLQFEGCTNLKDVYYRGTEAQWKAIKMDSMLYGTTSFGDDFSHVFPVATIHYNSTGPAAPVQPQQPTLPTVVQIPATGTAVAKTQSVSVDGKAVEFQCYALVEANGGVTNFVKLRDLAQILNGTAAQFAVGWDGAAQQVIIRSKESYAPNGSEGKTPFSGDRTYKADTTPVLFNGQNVPMTAFRLADDAGNGYTYYKLRDLGVLLNFNVGWTQERGVYVETDKPYQE